jgi:hypothetical protein
VNIQRLKTILESDAPGEERAFRILAWLAENETPWTASQGYNLHGDYSDNIYVRIGSLDDGVVGSDPMFTMAVFYAAGALLVRLTRQRSQQSA